MPNKPEKIIITDVPEANVEGYKNWAEQLGGTFTSFSEGDGEFTIIIKFPQPA